MRVLVSCPNCFRQYDASGVAPRSRFHCRCGTIVNVSAPSPREAVVVRCSSCGATREAGSLSCGFCGSDFTLHERDLHTICPACLARISDRARYCHHCATPIVPEEPVGELTDRACPVCGTDHPLRSRPLGHSEVSSLECGRCAGLWLGIDAFNLLLGQARKTQTPESSPPFRGRARRSMGIHPAKGPVYRPCPICSKRMNRSNFGRGSGVVIDRCRDHGTWFDAAELDRILAWVRLGGEQVTRDRLREEERTAASAARFRVEPRLPEGTRWPGEPARTDSIDLLPWIVRFFGVQ